MRWRAVAAIVLFLAAVPVDAQMPGPYPRTDTWVPDGPIEAATAIGSTLYLGGTFNQIGPLTGSFSVVDAGAGLPDTALPQFLDGDVLDIAPDGTGGWFVVGTFLRVNGVVRHGVARLRPDGSLDPWAPSISGEVRAVAAIGNRVFVGGVGLYEVDGLTGAATSLNLTGFVNTLVIDGGILYVGGSFTSLMGAPRLALGAIDLATTQVRPFGPAVQGNISAMLVRGTSVYVGGSFSSIAGQPRANIAAVNADTGAVLPFNPGADASVYALAADATTLYLGGRFSTVATQPRSEVAAVSVPSGQLLPFQPLVQSAPGASQTEVTALALQGFDLYLGGTFGRIAGQTRRGMGAVDAVSGSLRPWDPRPAGGSWTTNALEPAPTGIAVGGRFRIVGGASRVGAAAMDLATGAVLPWTPQVQLPAGNRLSTRSMTSDATRVFISGRIEPTPGGSAGQEFLRAFDGTTGVEDLNFVSFAQAVSMPMAVAGSNLCLPCTTTGGVYSLCGLDLTTGDLAWSIPVQNVGAMTADPAGHHLYVMLGLSLSGVALPGGILESWSIPASQTVATLGAAPGRIIAGGGFSTFGGVPRGALAALAYSPPSPPTVASWAPLLGGSGGRSVSVVAVRPPIAYIAGSFETIGGAQHPMLAGINLFSPTACLWWPSVQGSTIALAATPAALAVIGPRTMVGSRQAESILVYTLSGCRGDADANCLLNANDFIAFQSLYAAGNPMANCDQSTIPPVLNVNDFICFQSAFAAGCP